MPFKSKKQESWMFENNPRMAMQRSSNTPNMSPEDVDPLKKKKKGFPALSQYLNKGVGNEVKSY